MAMGLVDVVSQLIGLLMISVNASAELNGYIIDQYLRAMTAYGPGLGVFAPYTYVDISYNDIPLIGKIPTLGKEGTSSRLGISPFYPEEGVPGIAALTLTRANPLPPHVPEPVDVVAVPLDEEALHGEPLFPKELVLPSEMEFAGSETEGLVKQPFGEEEFEDKVFWPSTMQEADELMQKSKLSTSKEDETKHELPQNPFQH